MENYNVGDILYGTCGYNRTDVHFYKVLDKTLKTLTIQEIESEVVDGDPIRTYYVVADETKLKERRYRDRKNPYGEDIIDTKPFKVHINKYGVAVIRDGSRFDNKWLYVWDGKPRWANTGFSC